MVHLSNLVLLNMRQNLRGEKVLLFMRLVGGLMQQGMPTFGMEAIACIKVMVVFPIKYYFGRQINELF